MTQQIFDEVRPFLSEVLNLADPPQQTADTISAILKDYEQEKKMKIAVVGEFSNGKSAFINSLFGRQFLPMGITPTTSVLHYIYYGDEESVVIQYRNGEQMNYSLEQYFSGGKELQRAVKEDDNPMVKVDVFIQHELCRNFVFIDTPGLEDPLYPDYETLYQILPITDIVIFVLSFSKLLSLTEKTFLSEKLYKGDLQKIVILVNKIDLCENTDDSAMKVKSVKYFTRSINPEIPVLLYSAKKNLDMYLEKTVSNEYGFNDIQSYIKNWNSNRKILKEKYFQHRLIYSLQQLSMFFDTRLRQVNSNVSQLESTEKKLADEAANIREEITFVMKKIKVKMEIFFKQFENEFIHDLSEFKYQLREKMAKFQPKNEKFGKFMGGLTGEETQDVSAWQKIISDTQTQLKDNIEKNAMLFESQLQAILLEETQKQFSNISITPDGLVSKESLAILFREVGQQEISTVSDKIAIAAAISGVCIASTGNIQFGAPLAIGGYLLSTFAKKRKLKEESSLVLGELDEIIDKVIADVRKTLIIKQNEIFTSLKKEIEEVVGAGYVDSLKSIASRQATLKQSTNDIIGTEEIIKKFEALNQRLQELLYKTAVGSTL